MQTLLFLFAAVTGDISHEAIREAEHPDPWVHERTRLHLLSHSESYEASGYAQYDAALDRDERMEWRLENLLLRRYQGSWQVSLGWQTLHWGETLGPSLIDLVNPRDLRDPSDWLHADRKLAVPLAMIGWSQDSVSVDAWLALAPPPALLPDAWQTIPLEQHDRRDIPEYGLRGGTRVAGWDMKLYALRHRARLPALSLTLEDSQPRFEATFPLQTTLGFTVSQAWDKFVLRSEYVHAETKAWPEQSRLDFAADQAVVGLDGTIGDHFFWGTEVRYQDAGWVIAQGRWNLLNDRLKPAIYLMQRLHDDDAYQRYEITADLSHNWNAGVSWEAFQSGKNGYFTQLLAYDRLGLTLQWEF